jgi:hypothetical protein
LLPRVADPVLLEVDDERAVRARADRAVPDVAAPRWRGRPQFQNTVGPVKLALGRAVFVVGLAPVVVPNWMSPFVPMVAFV